MNILLTSHRFYPDIGGIESITDILARYFSSAGHSVCLITQSQGDWSRDQQLPFRILRRPGVWQLLASYRWADVVLQNNLEVRQLWPLLVYRKPLVIGLQTWICSLEGRRSALHLLKLTVLRIADRLVACSNAVRLDSSPQAMVIGNPYNSVLFRVIPGFARRKQVAFLGRLVSDKGADMLLHSFAALRPGGWRLSVIGDGPERPGLECLAEELGVRPFVDFLGALQGEALVQALNQHEILVVPSTWREPFGIAALEGLACGCAVLASDGGGLPDAVGPAGLLFLRGNQTDLNNKLQLLLRDSALRDHLRARSTVHLQAFQQGAVCEQYLSLLEQARAGVSQC